MNYAIFVVLARYQIYENVNGVSPLAFTERREEVEFQVSPHLGKKVQAILGKMAIRRNYCN